MFGKDKKRQREEEAEQARIDAEYEAKFTAKNEKKKLEKTVGEIDKSIGVFVSKAAEAKAKGYGDMYNKCISFIKTAKVRKKQAEMFIFQIDAMQEMQNISKSSGTILASMNAVMGTLGKLSVDKTVLAKTQRDFQEANRELEKQSSTIDNALSRMEEFTFDDDESLSTSDADIESEINSYMIQNSMSVSSAPASGAPSSAPSVSSESIDAEMDKLKSLLQ